MIPIRPAVRERTPELLRLRRTLHAHPELGLEEEKSALLVESTLRGGGITSVQRMCGTGVVALVEGNLPGPTLLIRCDLDALPLQEENPHLEYRSTVPGKMHACGHDGHTAMALVAASILHRHREKVRGRVKFVFQPAEESPGGAKPMVEAGVLQNPSVDGAVALHLWNTMPTGSLGVNSGPMMAACDEFRITLHGPGGHGAYPHTSVDLVYVLSQVISGAQSIVSRNVNPLDSAVVTIGHVHAGHAPNVIPTQATLLGTLRSYKPEVRRLIAERLEAIARSIATAFGATVDFNYVPCYPPVINDRQAADFALAVGRQLLGSGAALCDPSMGGEDFSYFLEQVPGVFVFIGSRNEAKQCHFPHHSSHFNFDEEALPIGVEYLLRFSEAFGAGGGSPFSCPPAA